MCQEDISSFELVVFLCHPEPMRRAEGSSVVLLFFLLFCSPPAPAHPAALLTAVTVGTQPLHIGYFPESVFLKSEIIHPTGIVIQTMIASILM